VGYFTVEQTKKDNLFTLICSYMAVIYENN
jgi:hypothetical protein